MLQNLFSIRQFRLTKWSFLVHSITRNAPYIYWIHDLELWRTFRNGADLENSIRFVQYFFFVNNVFHKGPYGPPLRSNWPPSGPIASRGGPGVRLLLEGVRTGILSTCDFPGES